VDDPFIPGIGTDILCIPTRIYNASLVIFRVIRLASKRFLGKIFLFDANLTDHE
jgi:hypothetical protein